jgi:ubiquinone/menaquinone biosynthesis C-methylase UbiE
MTEEKRAHGVTPGLSRDYSRREATHQAAFLLPHLEPGLNLVDIGCGPGTITLGLAEAVAPGFVIGVDHDEAHAAAARALVSEHGRDNVTFERASAMLLPFDDESFDVAFENDMFVHLADQAVEAARQAFRVLKPGGLLAARDADASLALWGNPVDDLPVLDGLMTAWQASRGSDINLGSRLPSILRQAGFSHLVKSVSADTKGDAESVQAHAEITVSLLDGPLGKTALREGWADQRVLDRVKASILAWSEHPEAFFANVHIEVIGWKAG